MKTQLIDALVNDRKQYPERMNATVGRIKEVLDIIAPNKAESIFGAYLRKIPSGNNGLAFVSKASAQKVAKGLVKELSGAQVKKFISMLQDSEISTDEAIALHEKYKIPVSHLEKDLIFVRADGVWLYDTKGKKYLDMDSNYSVTNLGNENKEVALGIFNQANKLISSKEDRVHIPRARFLQVIHSMMPKGLTQFYWQNSGGEAVDKSIKIAKAFTKQKGVIALKGGFHGRTHGAVAVTYNPKYRAPFFLDHEDWVYFVEPGDDQAVEDLMKQGKAKIIIMEPVQGEEAGCKPLNAGFVKRVRAICDKYQGVLICDEVQSGFGRCATKPGQWWASDVYGIVPDIMSIGKSFGGGYPVTAVVTRPEISAAMKPGYDGSTFGGNPMAMVAAYIATRQMREKDITSNVVARSKQFLQGIEKLKKQFPDLIGEVRCTGLMLGIELMVKDPIPRFQEYLKENGIQSSLSSDNIARFLPPLVISKSEMDFMLKGIGKALAKLAS